MEEKILDAVSRQENVVQREIKQGELRRERKRSLAGKCLPPPAPVYLPNRYGSTHIALIEVEPARVFAHWELSEADLGPAQKHLLNEGQLVIRVNDVTWILFNGHNAHSHFDIPISRDHYCWHINLHLYDRSLIAELGVRGNDGSFVAFERSNCVQTPRACPSNDRSTQWMRVNGDPRERRRVSHEFGRALEAQVESLAPLNGHHAAPPTLMASICREDVVRAYARLCAMNASPVEQNGPGK